MKKKNEFFTSFLILSIKTSFMSEPLKKSWPKRGKGHKFRMEIFLKFHSFPISVKHVVSTEEMHPIRWFLQTNQ